MTNLCDIAHLKFSIDPECLKETQDQHDCAMLADRLCMAYQKMRDTFDRNVKGQCAFEVMIYFKRIQDEHPNWIGAIDRYLDANSFKGADCVKWAKQAYNVHHEWSRCMPKKPNTKKDMDHARSLTGSD